MLLWYATHGGSTTAHALCPDALVSGDDDVDCARLKHSAQSRLIKNGHFEIALALADHQDVYLSIDFAIAHFAGLRRQFHQIGVAGG